MPRQEAAKTAKGLKMRNLRSFGVFAPQDDVVERLGATDGPITLLDG